MKKLMIIGAIAATAVGYGAEASYWAQVYDAALTMKTGVCKAGKATAATVKYYENVWGQGASPLNRGDEGGFRKQATRKIVGVLWGCECQTIAAPMWRRYAPGNNGGNGRWLGGYAFWDQAADTYFVLPNTVFGWAALNRIGNDFKTVEGSWLLANNVDPQALYLIGSGFGKASVPANTCRAIVSKISGSFAGFRLPGTDDLVGNCPYCGIDNCSVEPFCDTCTFWVDNRALTAAYGTWSIKFNKTAANKLKSKGRITQSYTFKKAGNLKDVLTRMENFVFWLDRNGLDLDDDEDHGYEMSRDEVKLSYAYAVIPEATLNADGTVTIGDEELEADDELYLAALGYSLFESEEGEGTVPSVIDIAGVINQVVEGDAS